MVLLRGCWALMGLMFVVGVMNVLWSAALALFVLIEKTRPPGSRVGDLAGAALIAWGCVRLAAATFG